MAEFFSDLTRASHVLFPTIDSGLTYSVIIIKIGSLHCRDYWTVLKGGKIFQDFAPKPKNFFFTK